MRLIKPRLLKAEKGARDRLLRSAPAMLHPAALELRDQVPIIGCGIGVVLRVSRSDRNFRARADCLKQYASSESGFAESFWIPPES